MKNIFIKIILLFSFVFFALIFQKSVFSVQPIQIDFFYSSTCPHCANARNYLIKLEKKYPLLIINNYEVSDNSQKLIEFYNRYNVSSDSHGFVPAIFTNDKFYVGFSEEISKEIKQNIVDLLKNPVEKNLKTKTQNITKNPPIIEKLNSNKLTLPVIAILLGAIDGFNICSLSALLIILSLVLALKSRFKTLIFGSSFIITTAIVYSFLIFFWYQLFNIITPYLRQMELIIGFITLGAGIYFLKEFIKFIKQGPACEIGQAQKIESGFSRKFQSLLDNKAKTITILISILLFATVITIVEFPCSAAVPVAFAGMLTKAQLSGWLYIFYIILYVTFYMLDELLVFFIAFFTSKLWLASPKFITWITLFESIILFSLGIYYIFGAI